MINGIIIINKEKGFTSHDVCAKTRGILKQKKVGHTGTLDPDAEGVLPVCLGNATKLCDILTDKTKEYIATLLLGTITDTLDTSGEILEEKSVNVSETQVKDAIMSFVGKSMQVPPMYSALKVNGKKLYELARAGIEVERKPRPIEIFEIEILDMHLPEVVFRVSCSKGTYIRSLCDDIGRKLGCGGCMKHLIRSRVENFYLKDAVTLQELEQFRDENRLDEIVISVDQVYGHLRKVSIKQSFDRVLENGNVFVKDMIDFEKRTDLHESQIIDGLQVLVYHSNGLFYGIYSYCEGEEKFKPYKMFIPQE